MQRDVSFLLNTMSRTSQIVEKLHGLVAGLSGPKITQWFFSALSSRSVPRLVFRLRFQSTSIHKKSTLHQICRSGPLRWAGGKAKNKPQRFSPVFRPIWLKWHRLEIGQTRTGTEWRTITLGTLWLYRPISQFACAVEDIVGKTEVFFSNK